MSKEPDEERLVAEIQSELKQLVDADERTNKEVVQAALWREFGGKRKGLAERQIEEKQSQLRSIRSEKSDLTEEEQRLENQIEVLQERVDDMEDADDRLEDTLDDLLDDMEGGLHIYPECEPIQELATEHGLDRSAVMDRLKRRAGSQARDITTDQFMRADHARMSDDPVRPVSEVYGDDE